MNLMILLRMWAEEEGYKVTMTDPRGSGSLHIGETSLMETPDGLVNVAKWNAGMARTHVGEDTANEWPFTIELHPAAPKFFDQLHSWILC
jgi:hypothetical protein